MSEGNRDMAGNQAATQAFVVPRQDAGDNFDLVGSFAEGVVFARVGKHLGRYAHHA